MNLSPTIKFSICVAASFLVSYILVDSFMGRTNRVTTLTMRTNKMYSAPAKMMMGNVKTTANETKIGKALDLPSAESVILDSPYVVPKSQHLEEEAEDSFSNITDAETTFNFESIWRPQKPNLPLCPEMPPGLQGKFLLDMKSPPIEEIEKEYPNLAPGGRWHPGNCTARNRVAIIIPYRDREEHLHGFLHANHRLFQRQQLDYAIFVVEQAGHNLTFNKGRLMNAGVLEALKLYSWQCFVFHDVDTLPANDQNLYTCPTDPNGPKHLGTGIADLGNRLLYEAFVGGATIFTEEQFRRANGYSNDFWGWGGEDDDFYSRVILGGMKFWRPSAQIGHYRRFEHERDQGNTPNPCRFVMLKKTKDKQPIDGLSTVRYRLKSIKFGKLYTHLMVDVLEEEYDKWQKYIKTLKGC